MDESEELSLEAQQEALIVALDALMSLLDALREVSADENLLADATAEEAATLDEASGELAALADEAGSLGAAATGIDLGAADASDPLTMMAVNVKAAWDGARRVGEKIKDTADSIADRGKEKLRDGADLAGDAAKRIANQLDQARKSRATVRILDVGGKILDVAGDVTKVKDCIELVIGIVTMNPVVFAPGTTEALQKGLRALGKVGSMIPRP